VSGAGEVVRIEQPPAIPGLAFRRFRGEADFPGMAALLNACAAADGLDYASTVEGLRIQFEHLVNCDPYQDMLFAEIAPPGAGAAPSVNGTRVIAFSRVWWRLEGTGERLYSLLGFVDPAWRRRGLGHAMLRYGEERLRTIARAHTGEPRSFQVWATDGEVGAHALFLWASYRPVRYTVDMLRPIAGPLHPAPLPVGLEVCPVLPEHIPAIWRARDEAYQDHWGYVSPTEEDYRRWRAGPLFNPALWVVAWEGDRVAGMVLNRIDEAENARGRRRRGYTQDIFVLRPWRRRGLARALLTQSIERFRTLGMEETALSVDTQNPNRALALYESVGYREVRGHTFYRKPME
jgi:mycothiol synthase